MSYVDISWPWGLVCLGVSPILATGFVSASSSTRSLMVMAAYVLSGLRMGLGAVTMALSGHLDKVKILNYFLCLNSQLFS